MSNLQGDPKEKQELLCFKCDSPNRTQANFCRNCGHPLKNTAVQPSSGINTLQSASFNAYKSVPVSDEEISHLKKLQETYLKRLRILEQKAARDGFNVSPEILLEIEEIRKNAESVTQKINIYNESAEYRSETVNLQFDINHNHKTITQPLQNIVLLRVALTLSVQPDTIEVMSVTSNKISMRIAAPMSTMIQYFNPDNESSNNKSTIVRNLDINQIQLVNIQNSFVIIRNTNEEIILFDMRKTKLLFEGYDYQGYNSILIDNDYLPLVAIKSIKVNAFQGTAILKIKLINGSILNKSILLNTHILISPRKSNNVNRLFSIQVCDIDYLEFYWSERALQIGHSYLLSN